MSHRVVWKRNIKGKGAPKVFAGNKKKIPFAFSTCVACGVLWCGFLFLRGFCWCLGYLGLADEWNKIVSVDDSLLLFISAVSTFHARPPSVRQPQIT